MKQLIKEFTKKEWKKLDISDLFYNFEYDDFVLNVKNGWKLKQLVFDVEKKYKKVYYLIENKYDEGYSYDDFRTLQEAIMCFQKVNYE